MGHFDGIGALEEYARLVRSDPEFRARLRAEPAAALAERGLPALPGIELKAVEDRAGVRHFVLPPNPNAVLPDRKLRAVAGGISPGLINMMPYLHLLQPR